MLERWRDGETARAQKWTHTEEKQNTNANFFLNA